MTYSQVHVKVVFFVRKYGGIPFSVSHFNVYQHLMFKFNDTKLIISLLIFLHLRFFIGLEFKYTAVQRNHKRCFYFYFLHFFVCV
jgi:hypothetical protein